VQNWTALHALLQSHDQATVKSLKATPAEDWEAIQSGSDPPVMVDHLAPG
jgi:hypothetical protein